MEGLGYASELLASAELATNYYLETAQDGKENLNPKIILLRAQDFLKQRFEYASL